MKQKISLFLLRSILAIQIAGLATGIILIVLDCTGQEELVHKIIQIIV